MQTMIVFNWRRGGVVGEMAEEFTLASRFVFPRFNPPTSELQNKPLYKFKKVK